MIKNRVVYGEPQLEISENLCYGKYVIDKLRNLCARENNTAMINALSQEHTSYAQLLTKIIRVAKGFKKMQLTRGDVVAICSENSIEFIAVTLGAVCVGASVTTLGVKYTKEETLHALSISQPKVVLCSESAIETKLQILHQAPDIQHVIQIQGAVKEPDVLSLDDIMIDEDDVENYEPESGDAAEDIAFIIYGAGTTGVPKGIMLTHRNVVYGSEIFNYANVEQSNVLTIPPWYHLYGLLTTIQYVVSGNLLVYMPKFDPDKYLATVEKYQITKIIAVPQILTLLSKSPLITKYDLSSVKVVWCATIPVVSVDSIIGAKNNLPNCRGIFQAYGLTETSVAVLKEPEIYNESLLKEGSCGAPLPGIQAKVVDLNTGEKLEAYQNGEICLKGPTMMKGFLNNEQATRDIYDEGGFLKTGDVGYYDTNGCFYITDVVTEIINYKGYQVSPADVESVVVEHGSVRECGVVGARDAAAGELPTAFVVTTPGAELTQAELIHYTNNRVSPADVESVVVEHGSVRECGVVGARDAAAGELPTAFVVTTPGAELTQAELIHYTNNRLPPHCQLHRVIFVEEIPRSESGKVLRRVLRNQLRDYND